jgi:hypothetical protein
VRSKALILAVAFLCMAFATTALAGTLSWFPTPILGTSVYYDGDVVVNTGPVPYAIPDDNPGYSGGYDSDYNPFPSPSMTLFFVGQSVATGSGVWVDPGATYDIVGVFLQLSGPQRTTTYGEEYTATTDPCCAGYVMEAFTSVGNLSMLTISGDPLIGLSSADIGNWTYTETWTNQAASSDTITSTDNFTVAATPEPGTMLLLGAALLGLAALRHSRKLS